MDSGDGWKSCTYSDGTVDSVGAGVTFEGCVGLEGAWVSGGWAEGAWVSDICSKGDWVICVWAVGAWESDVWAE